MVLAKSRLGCCCFGSSVKPILLSLPGLLRSTSCTYMMLLLHAKPRASSHEFLIKFCSASIKAKAKSTRQLIINKGPHFSCFWCSGVIQLPFCDRPFICFFKAHPDEPRIEDSPNRLNEQPLSDEPHVPLSRFQK